MISWLRFVCLSGMLMFSSFGRASELDIVNLSNYAVAVKAGRQKVECMHKLTLQVAADSDLDLSIHSVCQYDLVSRMRDLRVIERIGNAAEEFEENLSTSVFNLHPYAKKWITTGALSLAAAKLVKENTGKPTESDAERVSVLTERVCNGVKECLVDLKPEAFAGQSSAAIVRNIGQTIYGKLFANGNEAGKIEIERIMRVLSNKPAKEPIYKPMFDRLQKFAAKSSEKYVSPQQLAKVKEKILEIDKLTADDDKDGLSKAVLELSEEVEKISDKRDLLTHLYHDLMAVGRMSVDKKYFIPAAGIAVALGAICLSNSGYVGNEHKEIAFTVARETFSNARPNQRITILVRDVEGVFSYLPFTQTIKAEGPFLR